MCEDCSPKKRRISRTDSKYYRICEDCDNYFGSKITEEVLLSILSAKEQTLSGTKEQLFKTMTELNEQNSKLGELKNKVLLFSMILQKKN